LAKVYLKAGIILTDFRPRSTRIIATLGPASDSEEMIEKLFHAGADVFRLNMSHGNHQGKKDLVEKIRTVEERVGRPIAIMIDLQGPKLRVGTFKDGAVTLNEGAEFTLDQQDNPGDATRVTLPHPELFRVMEPGSPILLDDGKIGLEVKSASPDRLQCIITRGGALSDNKGVNVPKAILPLAALTEKDRKDLDFAMTQNVDWIALSFVQRPEDVAEAKAVVKGRAGVLAKIEKPAALTRLDEIIEIADAVMVARGDLGVEAALEEVPTIQKQIIHRARAGGKPVVVATQMLESMITTPVPTRAEVSDVANAVFDDTDAIMLSAESAVGKYPVEAVRLMDKVAQQVEGDATYKKDHLGTRADPHATAEDAITAAAKQVAQTVSAAAIVTFTTSGSTALRAARERPGEPILVLTPRLDVARRLSLVWGLHAVKTGDVSDFEEMIAKSKAMALQSGLAKVGDRIVVTAGVPFGTPGATNVLHIGWIS
jgi:pyruvate kinase